MKRLFTSILTTLLVSIAVYGQATEASLQWKSTVVRNDDGRYELTLRAITPEPMDEDLDIHGTVNWIACFGNQCHSPEEYTFELNAKAPKRLKLGALSSSAPAGPDSSTAMMAEDSQEQDANSTDAPTEKGKGLWALILEAVLWGFAMLLTPCVFPMVPMTVSFFLKNSGSKTEGKFKAATYGLFIVLLYTVPICIIIGATWLAGGPAVTADIFNWISTHWLPNILFFIIFMIFAASFFGAFEITLPASLVGKTDKNADKAGLAGVFFMALTLVLVSFSCTGPIVGTVLIKSTEGEFWTPMITMLAFSLAFSLPFTVLALFPSLLSKIPKSGSWLNSVKVTLGFIEIALGLKFLSVADQTYHWGLLDREVYLAIWIVCFMLLGLYLLGKIRFKEDSPLEYLSVKRLVLVIADFAFVVYLIPGMWGAPLKALSGYLPPLETQDFVISAEMMPSLTSNPTSGATGTIKLPHGLAGYSSLEDAQKAALALRKNIFVDITGHGCVNCREMESRVWSDPQVLSMLRDDYVILALYVDDKLRLPEEKWVVADDGTTLKDVGRANAYIAKKKFGVNAQPNYFILSPSGDILAGPRGYDLGIDGFVNFLKGGK